MRAKDRGSAVGVVVAGATDDNEIGVIEVSLDLGHGLVLRIVRRRCSFPRAKSACSSMASRLACVCPTTHWADLNALELAQFVPKTPNWRRAHLPSRLAWEDVRRAVDAIETTTPSGMRDQAMILLLAATGVRNRELRELELGDIRWRTGELVLRHTKGHRDRVVPLLGETGAALARYLLRARQLTTERRIFLSCVPPVRSFCNSSNISRIVRFRLERAGIQIQRGGAHLLRHSLATRLVEQRRPIKEVADLLGHRNIDTTAIYVKVAVPQLADVALPFPGGAS
jgi:integrase/recombinase XerD